MNRRYWLIAYIFLPAFLLMSCSTQKEKKDRIVIAIPSDAESLNPLFSFSFQEVNITEMLYLGLVEHEWDETSGSIITKPLIAKSWSWNQDSTSISLELRNDITWRDGKKLTAEDVIFSFDIYSDPNVQSRFFGNMNKFYLEDNLHIDIAKSFESDDPYKLKINFRSGTNPSLVDIDAPILPKHIFERFSRKDIAASGNIFDTVTSGSFYLAKWEKNQAIVLRRNERSFLFDAAKPKEIVFKIITDYNAKLTQLKNGSVDFIDNVKPDQVDELKHAGNIIISSVKGREYDYAAWNNKKLFGSSNVRKALTYAINREEILSGFLNNNGQLASGPVSDIFIEYHDSNIKPRPYDPDKAREILKSEGWVDNNNDGVLEKNGVPFSFTLNYGAGNPRREFAATVIKNNLKAVGIEIKTEAMEPGIFFEKMFRKELNAWLGGWSVPIPLDLTPYWHSDSKKGSLNLTSYKNAEVDKLLNQINSTSSKEKKISSYKKIQQFLYEDEPVTFLYWVNNITAYSNKLKNIKITPLGSIHRCRDWSLN